MNNASVPAAINAHSDRSAVRPQQLARLLVKYQTILRWREQRDLRLPLPSRTEFRALATEFPGVLRELDTLPLALVRDRCAQLAFVVDGGAEPVQWMLFSVLFHEWMSAALWLRANRAVVDDPSALALLASAQLELSISTEFVQQMLSPNNGRMRAAVVEQVARVTGDDAAVIRHALFASLRGV